MMKLYIKIVWVLLLVTASSQAEINIESKDQNIPLLGVPYFEDKHASLSFEEVKRQSFNVVDKSVASFGFTHSKFWFKIEINPQVDTHEQTWWLNISYPLLDKIDLYSCDENGTLISLKKSGKLRPFSEREAADRNFLFKLDMKQKQIFYLSVQTQSSMQVPMSIQTSYSLMTQEQYLLVLAGLYYGIFIIIFFYNLISFIYTRKRSYFLYLIFITSFSIYQLSLDGLGLRFLWSDWYWMIHHGNGTMMGIMTLTIIVFSREFLMTKKFAPFLDKFLIVLAAFIFIVAILATFMPYGNVILPLAGTAVILPPLLMFLGIVAYRKKLYSARFYIVGWGFFLGGSALFAMNKFAIIEGFTFLSYAQQVGSALEMIFLSWSLADMQKQSEREYLQKLSGLNTFLQEKVDESLKQMRKNDQMMIETSRLAAMGEMIEQIAHQWRQPLNTLALINQNFYFKVQLNTIDKNDCTSAHDQINDQLQYMSQTIDDFRNFSHPNKDKEPFIIEEVIKSALNLSEGSLKYLKIKPKLICECEHHAFGMRHEMMQVLMNLIKNVQDIVKEKTVKEPWIKFSVEDEASNTVITIEDNAGGIFKKQLSRIFEPYFSTKKGLEGSGIGLYMSKEIIEKSMNGSISVTNGEYGAIFKIVLPKVSLDKS